MEEVFWEDAGGGGLAGGRGRRWLGWRAEAEVVGAEGSGGSGQGLGGARRRQTWSGRMTAAEVVGVEDGDMGVG